LEFRGMSWQFSFSQVPEKPGVMNKQFEITTPDGGTSQTLSVRLNVP
jgi:hypothetical protein